MRVPLSATATVAIVAGLVAAGPASAAFPGRNGEIAVRSIVLPPRGSDAPGFQAIEAVRPDGTGRRVVCECGANFDVAFSPDGGTLAFDGGDPGDVSLIRADGTGLRALPAGDYVLSVAWSPGGRRLLFADLPRRTEHWTLYTSAPDGRAVRHVTRKGIDETASWSTTGRIAFSRRLVRPDGSAAGKTDIWVMRATGGGLRRVTGASGYNPDWSPHGKWIAFERQNDVYVVQPDSRGLRRVTTGGGTDPVWSPDGKWIALIRSGDLYVVRPDGTGLRKVAEHRPEVEPESESTLDDPTWQPLR